MWTAVNTTQTPNWQNISNTPSVTWTSVTTTQSPNWTPVAN